MKQEELIKKAFEWSGQGDRSIIIITRDRTKQASSLNGTLIELAGMILGEMNQSDNFALAVETAFDIYKRNDTKHNDHGNKDN